jgi:hypothetical protein
MHMAMADTLCHINVTVGCVSKQNQNLQQIDRLVGSRTLHGSDSLCKLLRYLAKHSLEHPGESMKEYQIAREVFGRQPDFDPQLDSLVRVQAGRLRSKLAEYYESEGAEDPVWVDLPKGAYVVTFHHGPPVGARNHNHGAGTHEGPREAFLTRDSHGSWRIATFAVSLALVIAIAAIAALLMALKGPKGASASEKDVPAVYQTFWKSFLTTPEEPWVIFSNAAFVGRPDVGMRYYNSSRDAGALILDHYTGVGEVLAIHNLDTVFNSLGRSIRVKRGSLFSLDDAKNNDLILIGSPSENLTLLDIPATHEFIFKQVSDGDHKGNMEIINAHSEPGEAKEYLATSSRSPLSEDYAIVALEQGLNPIRSVLILAGTTTIGTQAAVEYVCRQDSLEKLLLRLSVGQSGQVKPFEAVIRVKVTRGVPVESELVALRKVGT